MTRPRSRRPRLVLVATLSLLAVFAFASPVAAVPADGNGNKFVVNVSEIEELQNIPIDCGTETIWLDLGGWAQFREFKGQGNRNLELGIFHLEHTYRNASGATFEYLDVGPDRAYLDRDGNLIVTITGRPANAGDMGFSLMGHMVINLDTGEAVWHGNVGPTSDEQACAALTG